MEDDIFGISSSPKLLHTPTTSRAASPNRRRPSKKFLKENVSMYILHHELQFWKIYCKCLQIPDQNFQFPLETNGNECSQKLPTVEGVVGIKPIFQKEFLRSIKEVQHGKMDISPAKSAQLLEDDIFGISSRPKLSHTTTSRVASPNRRRPSKQFLKPDKPSLEEVLSWEDSANGFENLMSSSKGRTIFGNFLRTEFSDENLKFWEDCEELKTVQNYSLLKLKVEEIYQTYLDPASSQEVRISVLSHSFLQGKM